MDPYESIQSPMSNKSYHKTSRLKSFVIFCVVPFALAAHIAIGYLAGTQYQWPLVECVFIAASLMVLLRMWARERFLTRWLGFLNVISWVLAGVFLWWTQIYSSYSGGNSTLQIGDYLTNVPNIFDSKEIEPQRYLQSEKNNVNLLPGLSPFSDSEPKGPLLNAEGNGHRDIVNDDPVTTSSFKNPLTLKSLSQSEPESASISSHKATLFVFLRGWW